MIRRLSSFVLRVFSSHVQFFSVTYLQGALREGYCQIAALKLETPPDHENPTCVDVFFALYPHLTHGEGRSMFVLLYSDRNH